MTEQIRRYAFPAAEGYPAFDMVSYADHLAALAKAESERDALYGQLEAAQGLYDDANRDWREMKAERDALKARNEEIYADNLAVSKWKGERIRELEALCREYIDALDSGYDVLASYATDKIREAVK